MGRKENPDPIAAAMVAKRWEKTTKKERSEMARQMAIARWGEKPKAKRSTKKSS